MRHSALKHQTCLLRLKSRSKWLVEEGTPQAIASTALAFAKLGFQAPNLFAEIERRSRWLVESGTPQSVANTAWACATLNVESPMLFTEIERRSKWLVESGTPQGVANTALACAKLNFAAPNLFAEIETPIENGSWRLGLHKPFPAWLGHAQNSTMKHQCCSPKLSAKQKGLCRTEIRRI